MLAAPSVKLGRHPSACLHACLPARPARVAWGAMLPVQGTRECWSSSGGWGAEGGRPDFQVLSLGAVASLFKSQKHGTNALPSCQAFRLGCSLHLSHHSLHPASKHLACPCFQPGSGGPGVPHLAQVTLPCHCPGTCLSPSRTGVGALGGQ